MKRPRPLFRHRAFTLVEVLVAVSVLVLIVVFIAQINTTIATTIHLSNRKNTTDADARIAFRRIGQDLQNLVKRSDVDFLGGNLAPWTGGSSSSSSSSGYLLLFFTKVASAGSPSGGNRHVSVVGYQIAASADNSNLPCLLRAGQAVGWSTAGFMGLNATGLPVRFSDGGFPPTLLPNASASPSDFDVVAPGVIEMVVGFQLYPDNQPVVLQDGSTVKDGSGGSNAQGQWVYSPPVRMLKLVNGVTLVPYVDLSRVSSILIGLVVLDRSTLKLLSSSQVAKIVQQFPVPDTNKFPNQLPLQAWNTKWNSLASFLSSTVPLPALQSVRIYECAFPITPAGAVFGE